MAFTGSIFGPQPARLEILPSKRGEACVDVDKNSVIDDRDANLTLESRSGPSTFDFDDIKKALAAFGPGKQVSEKELVGALSREYNVDHFEGMGLMTGQSCFDMISTYRQKQTFEIQGDKLFYNLTPDPDAPVQHVAGGEKVAGNGDLSLVKDADGILHWDYNAPAPHPPDPDAVKEAVCVRRDGILHWVFPGEKLERGDEVIGNADNFADNLLKQR